MARPRKKPICKAPCSRRSHEHFGAVHPAADRHGPADGGPAAGRAHHLPAVACRIPAERQLSHDPGVCAAARRRSPNHGVVGSHPARATDQPNSRRNPADFVQRAWQYPAHRSVRPQPHRRQRGGRRAGGDQCRQPLSADRHSLSADHPEGESRGCADPGARAHVGYAAADHGRRLCGKHPAAEDLATSGRGSCRHWRPAEAGDPGAGQPAGARGPRHRA